MQKLPKRKINRLEEYDYSQNGAYFITICTKDMKCILSRIVGDGVLDVPQVCLSEYGYIVEKQIAEMNSVYENIKTERFVIMPNHVHLLVKIANDNSGGTSRTPSPTNSLVSRYVSTLKRLTNKQFSENIWQRSFHDHIIRSEEDYYYHLQYIDENPKKWLMGKDEYYG